MCFVVGGAAAAAQIALSPLLLANVGSYIADTSSFDRRRRVAHPQRFVTRAPFAVSQVARGICPSAAHGPCIVKHAYYIEQDGLAAR